MRTRVWSRWELDPRLPEAATELRMTEFPAAGEESDWSVPVSYTHLDVYKRQKNNPVTQIAAAASIAFVVLAEGGQIDDVTATENVEQFAPWALSLIHI